MKLVCGWVSGGELVGGYGIERSEQTSSPAVYNGMGQKVRDHASCITMLCPCVSL